jgi:putative transposase
MRINKIKALHGYRTRRFSVPKPAVIAPDLIKRNLDVVRPNNLG